MIKIFIKSIISLFLVFIVMVNIALTFNMSSSISAIYNTYIDTSTKYFGVSSIIQFFQSGFQDDYFIGGLQNFLNNFSNQIRNNLVGKWISFSNSGGITDIVSFFVAVGNFFTSIFAILEILVYSILYIIFTFLILAWVIIKLWLLLGGFYVSDLPSYPYSI